MNTRKKSRLHPVLLTAEDHLSLTDLLSRSDILSEVKPDCLNLINRELQRATITQTQNIPHDVITVNSQVLLFDLDSGQRFEVTLCLPSMADPSRNRISIFSNLGVALIGFREGQEIRWNFELGTLRFRILKVLFQPEREMHRKSPKKIIVDNHEVSMASMGAPLEAPTSPSAGLLAGHADVPVGRKEDASRQGRKKF